MTLYILYHYLTMYDSVFWSVKLDNITNFKNLLGELN